VCIVGAGAAGIYAANYFHTMGIKDYIVCEASERLGGRVRTDKDGVEIGGEFVHGEGSLLSKLLKRIGAKTRLAFDWEEETGIQFYHKGQFFGSNSKIIKELNETLENMLDTDKLKEPNDVSFKEYLEQNNKSKDVTSLVDARLAKTNGTDNDKQSVLGHTLEDDTWPFGVKNFQLEKGYSMTQVIEYLAKPLEKNRIWRNHTVHTIDYSNPWKIVINDGEIICDYVIVTVPISILKQRNTPFGLTFNPPLPKDKAIAIDQMLGMDAGHKVHLYFKKPVWGRTISDKHSVVIITDHPLITQMWFPGTTQTKDGLYVVNGFSTGSATVSAKGVCDQYAIESFRDLLAKMYGHDRNNDGFVRGHVFDWKRDAPTVFGAYSYSKVTKGQRWDGQNHPRNVLARSIDKRVFFAGEGTSLHAFATIQGGLESGETAARQVLGAMQNEHMRSRL
jgi:lysine-specific histone demethylase 1B